MGHGPALLSTEASGRCRFSQATFPGAHGNGRDAPIPAVRCATIEPPEWTPLDLHDRAAGQAAPPESSPSSWGRLLVLWYPLFTIPIRAVLAFEARWTAAPNEEDSCIILDCACAPILTGTAGGTSAKPSPLPRTPEKD